MLGDVETGVIVPLGVYAIDKKLDDPVGALTAHGLCGVWGTLACGIFTSPRLAEYNAFGDGGLLYTGSFGQLGTQALGVVTVFTFVFTLSFATFWLIKKTYGLRVTAEEEEAGLDITEHGMYGYPEQFIPMPEQPGPAYGGVLGAFAVSTLKLKTIDIGMVGNGMIAGLVGITAPSGYVEVWAAPIIGAVAGVIVVVGVLAIEKVLDDPVGALSAHGAAGIWGTLSCGIFTSPRLADLNGVGDPGLVYSGSIHQFAIQALG